MHARGFAHPRTPVRLLAGATRAGGSSLFPGRPVPERAHPRRQAGGGSPGGSQRGRRPSGAKPGSQLAEARRNPLWSSQGSVLLTRKAHVHLRRPSRVPKAFSHGLPGRAVPSGRFFLKRAQLPPSRPTRAFTRGSAGSCTASSGPSLSQVTPARDPEGQGCRGVGLANSARGQSRSCHSELCRKSGATSPP